MDRPTCETCVYWQIEYEGDRDSMKHCSVDGRCHRRVVDKSGFYPMWSRGWCGEHQDFPVYVEWLRQEKTKGGVA